MTIAPFVHDQVLLPDGVHDAPSLLRPAAEVGELRSTPGSVQETFMGSTLTPHRKKYLDFWKDIDSWGLFHCGSVAQEHLAFIRAEENQPPLYDIGCAESESTIRPTPAHGPLRERGVGQDLWDFSAE